MSVNGVRGDLGQMNIPYGKGAIIFEEGDAAKLTFRICDGWVRLQKTGSDGVRKIIAFLGPGETFGAYAGRNFASAEAVTATSLQTFDVARLADLLDQRPELALQFLTDSLSREASFAGHVNALLRLTAPERVLEFLVDTAAKVPAETSTGFVRLPMTREDISDFLGLAPATLSRVLKKLQKDGWLSLSGPRNFALRAPAEQVRRGDGWRDDQARYAALADRIRDVLDAAARPAPRRRLLGSADE